MFVFEVFAFVICATLGWFLVGRVMRRRAPAVVDHRVVRTLPSAIDHTGPLSRFDNWLARVTRCGRVPWAPNMVAMLVGGLVLVVSAVAFVATENLLTTFWSGIMVLAIALLGLQYAAHRTVTQFEQQLPLALDLMARAVSAGESLDQAIQLVSESVEEPARSEFQRCHNQLEVGLSVRAALTSMAERIDTMNVRIMGSILSTHRETGGNLSETLHRLAKVVRQRFDYERRLRTVTGAGRVSLFIVIVLAWCLLGYLFIARPEYGQRFFESSSGRKMLTAAILLELAGIVWGWMLLKGKY